MPQEDKPVVEITVSGRPLSGKSTVVSAIAHCLQSLGIEVDIRWGIEGEPRSHRDQALTAKKIRHISGRSKVVITEKQLPRKGTEDANPTGSVGSGSSQPT